MLGTFRMSAYKSIDDFASHKDYLNYMYGEVKGFVARLVRLHISKGFTQITQLNKKGLNCLILSLLKIRLNLFRIINENQDSIMFFGSDYKPLLEGRISDLKRLFAMRKGNDCRRECALFLCRLWVCELTNDFDYALHETLAFNKSFDKPLNENSVIKTTASAEKKVRKGSTYKYSKKKIIEILAITDEEMKHLNYLCDTPQTEKERKRKSNHNLYLKKLEKAGKSEKRYSVELRREQIIFLLAENKSKQEICTLLNISVRTYERDRAAIAGQSNTKKIIGKIGDTVNKVVTTENVITDVKDAVNPAVSMLATEIQHI